jgi:ferredoxin-NADP reductase
MSHQVKLVGKQELNHDVIRFHFEKPLKYQFVAGQAIELFIEVPEKKGPGPFTFTGLNREANLELTIKIYKEHNGLTEALSKLNLGDEVFISDPWDSFTNKGPGIFIAGGAGITPFIAMLRQMHEDGTIGDSHLYFFNKTGGDLFMQEELKRLLADRYVDILTREKNSQRLDEELFARHLGKEQPYYVCGPPGFVEKTRELLHKIGAANDYVNISL